jgi:hypothetical protein
LAVKSGLSYSWANIKTLQNRNEGREDSMTGAGFNTHVAYKWTSWEFALSSYIFWGDADGLRFRAQGNDIEGDATYRHVSFGPILRYTILSLPVYKNWHPYFGLGPSWSLQTIKMDEPQTNGTFNSRQKLTYESRGGFLVLGLEEQVDFKEYHPVYIEFLYSYKKSRNLSVVDSNDPIETNILSTEETKQDLSGHFYMISIGITLF